MRREAAEDAGDVGEHVKAVARVDAGEGDENRIQVEGEPFAVGLWGFRA